jgi:hypothetical protein
VGVKSSSLNPPPNPALPHQGGGGSLPPLRSYGHARHRGGRGGSGLIQPSGRLRLVESKEGNGSVASKTGAGRMPAVQPARRRRYKPLATATLFSKSALVLPGESAAC